MTTPTAQSAGLAPLSGDELARIQMVARRLRGELRALIEKLPRSCRGPSGLGRHLEIDRATAHRLLTVAFGQGAELDWLRGAPGVQAFEQFITAVREHEVDEDRIAALETAVEQFDVLITDFARSKAELVRRIRASVDADSDDDSADAAATELQQRRALYEAARAQLGRHMAVRVDLMVLRGSRETKDHIEMAWVRGIVGHRARAGAPPLTVGFVGFVQRDEHVSADDRRALTEEGELARGAARGVVLQDFTTMPLPIVTSRGAGDQLTQVIDPAVTSNGSAVDVFVAHRSPSACLDPRLEQRPVFELNALVREPTEALVLDVYLERELAQGCLPELELYLWSPTAGQSLADHWFDRLPTDAMLSILGQGISRSASALHPRHAELTAHVFTKLGWESDEFVGYRCEVRYPMWGGAYCIILDYGRPAAQRPE